MAINFVQGQVAVGDPVVNGPNPNSNTKDICTKTIKLTSANFTTGGTNTLVAVFSADTTILEAKVWVKTQLAGGSISAATINIGSASGGTQFASAFSVFGTAGAVTQVTPITGIVQNYALPLGPDIQFWVGGTATTGNPTSGEVYLIVYYVR